MRGGFSPNYYNPDFRDAGMASLIQLPPFGYSFEGSGCFRAWDFLSKRFTVA